MQETDLELGESLFVHRRCRVRLLVRTKIRLSCKDEYQSAPSVSDSSDFPPARDLWISRAGKFHLSLRLSFADNLDLASIQDLRGVVADRVENAEVSLMGFWFLPILIVPAVDPAGIRSNSH